MVIKALALELYQAQQRVHRLQEQIDRAAPGEKEALNAEMRVAKAERDQLRRLIDGKKSKPLARSSFKDRRSF